jgi:hypothetical protein
MYQLLANHSDGVGLIGVVLLLLAYFLLSAGKLSSHTLTYQWMNFIAAWLILFSLYFHWNLSSVVIEISWVIISIMGMARCIRSGRRQE